MTDEKLFSYGTLQQEEVQLQTFGRRLKGAVDFLENFRLEEVLITNPEVIKKSGKTTHPILVRGDQNDSVKGMVFDVTKAEIAQADEYEVSDYKRIAVQLKSGTQAWVYVSVKEV